MARSCAWAVVRVDRRSNSHSEGSMRGLNRVPITGVLVALRVLVGTAAATAQNDDEYDKIYPFLGHWDMRISMPDGQDRGSCGGRTDEFGVKLVNCSMPVDQLPLNARGQ